jgi:hypothetical protein
MGAATMTWGAVIGIAMGIPCGSLAVAGVQHLFARSPRRVLGCIELVGAALGVTALFAPRFVEAAAACFGALGVAFLGYLAWLWRTDRNRSCDCTPFATRVTPLSFVPATLLVAAACVGWAAAHSGAGVISVERALLFAVSAMLGWALLLWPPAAEG